MSIIIPIVLLFFFVPHLSIAQCMMAEPSSFRIKIQLLVLCQDWGFIDGGFLHLETDLSFLSTYITSWRGYKKIIRGHSAQQKPLNFASNSSDPCFSCFLFVTQSSACVRPTSQLSMAFIGTILS